MNLDAKLAHLESILKNYGNGILAFSGGVDSSFLLAIAYETLGDKLLAVTADSETYPLRELEWARKVIAQVGAPHLVIKTEELANPEFAQNPHNRCYHCKSELFGKLKEIASDKGFTYIFDGANADDVHDYRPGMQAGRELGVVSPLKEANLNKEEIRILSQRFNLPTWDKPSFACLSSRFPYGEEITTAKLRQVDQGEDFLRDLGFKQLRVRHHGNIARIEVPLEDLRRVLDEELRNKINDYFKALGFNYVTIDLAGFRSGSMNEVLSEDIING